MIKIEQENGNNLIVEEWGLFYQSKEMKDGKRTLYFSGIRSIELGVRR